TPTAPPTAISNIPPDAYMVLNVQATGEMYIWVLADNQEVYNGPLQNDERTFNAHMRLFVQVKNLINGRVTFNDRRILPRNQKERTDLSRAWVMNAKGTPVATEALPY